jgi:tetratricopeptide (TPR) repeat protein
VVKRRSAGPETQLKRALRTLARGQFRRGLRQLEKLLAEVEDDPTLTELAYLGMADACLSLRDLPATISHAQTAIELNPESERAYYLLGFAYSVAQDWDQAVSALRQAVALNPDEAEYYRVLGWALFNQDQANQEGLELLEQALNMAPTHIPILTDLAMVQSQAQNFDQALIYARRAVELAPSDPMARDILTGVTHFKAEFERLGGQPAPKPPAKPSTEAEWRELIATTDDYHQVMQLWIDLHPAKDMSDLNTSLQEFNKLWNSTRRSELGGRSPNEMMGHAGE